ncbi:E3 ubiquitin ligase BIG BROTHER-related [Alnus glutinosa]|uniref:E3 ubiquitin ligase BIG BROTHER-related n=1 Tax=Alnus glutinosa TaxID=3517 RepID=UPI002D791964|nr:E3 ubiquitin ligase BIG BROTHER-related [Alnus glutinosa]
MPLFLPSYTPPINGSVFHSTRRSRSYRSIFHICPSMDREENRQPAPRRLIPLINRVVEQVQSDLALAIILQEQERAFTRLATIESTCEEDDESNASDDGYFESQEVQAELEFLEGEEEEEEDSGSSSSATDDEEMDELSYEELIALGEFIGEEKRGLSTSDIPTCLRACKCKPVESKTAGGVDRCVICQVEYEEGEALVALACEHPFHCECISQWLQIKKICPICSTEVSPVPKLYTSL